MHQRRRQQSLYLLFFLSGFAGLIYESIWSQYLKLFLGHAAYAQALVLVLFMGGMALGAWLAARSGSRIHDPLSWYAAIELVIGLWAIAFDPVFRGLTGLSHTSIIPALTSDGLILTWKLVAASLMILPPSVMLGATFPLMSTAFLRRYPQTPGRTLSLLYFSNSLGAAISLLICSFWLIARFGLPGTLIIAGMINLVVAMTLFALRGNEQPGVPSAATVPDAGSAAWTIIILAFLTGAASFIYEITWIRMLSMVLGASTHAFELMLSAFITGLALGGYWIRGRIDRHANPGNLAGIVQVLMGLLALSTIVLYGYSFDVMAWIMAALDETPQGYGLFTLSSHAIALFIMLPTTLCAGMTLPLFTCMLLRSGLGEASIGRIYAGNTLGAICGVLFAVFIGMPQLGLKGSLLSGALIDIAIGLYLLRAVLLSMPRSRLVMLTVPALLCMAYIILQYDFDTRRMASGVFRHGIARLDALTDIIYHRDGRTASVTVTDWNDIKLSIMTNGKSDAAVTIARDQPPAIDESTMILLAGLPLSVRPDAARIANIGIGSGMTAHVALAASGIRQVDTIEIEPAMVEGARLFSSRTGRVFSDPRSTIHIDDARTFLSGRDTGYDLIISEPSNPWVSGVSSLFTIEFYRMAREHLAPKGLLVQWIHLYEFRLDLLISILKAIDEAFPWYSLYFADDGNLILLSGHDGPVAYPDARVFSEAGLRDHLQSIYVRTTDDLRYRFLGDQDLYRPWLENFDTPANSDYYPYLELGAARARFLQHKLTEILDIRLGNVPVLDILYGHLADRQHPLSPTEFFPSSGADNARRIMEYFDDKVFDNRIIQAIASLNFLASATATCTREHNPAIWADSLFLIIEQTVAWLTADQLARLVSAITPSCGLDQMPPVLADWLRFFQSFSSGDLAIMAASSGRLLDSGTVTRPEQARFLMLALLATLVASDQDDTATRLWHEVMKVHFLVDGEIPIEIQLLLSGLSIAD